MPWKGVTVSEQRQRFLEDYELKYYPSSELAERFCPGGIFGKGLCLQSISMIYRVGEDVTYLAREHFHRHNGSQ